MDVTIKTGVRIPMRDATELVADVYLPVGDGRFPTLVLRSPYGRQRPVVLSIAADVLRLAREGFAVVAQDCRGTYDSQGTFIPFVDEADDGIDTIAWAAAQPWSSGRVGMIGSSYFGATQWLAAMRSPESLCAIAAGVTTDQYYEGWIYKGGAFQLGFALQWALGAFAIPALARGLASGQGSVDEIAAAAADLDDVDRLYRTLPLGEIPFPSTERYFAEWLQHPTDDGYWAAIAPNRRFDSIGIPALNIGGWYDIFLGGTLANYVGMRERGANEAARSPKLVIGPWAHGLYTGIFPERRFGLAASIVAVDTTDLQIRWFDRWLRGHDNGVEHEAAVRIFVMGTDEWREADAWPLRGTQYRRYYLHSAGRANTRHGDGELSTAPPAEPCAPSRYAYDPRDPVPTRGGATLLNETQGGANVGPCDQAEIADRPDVLVFSTSPLEHDLEVIGPVRLVLYVASSALDTDFTGKLTDVDPDGRSLILTEGILRARYRSGFDVGEPMTPGEVYALNIDLVATANVFKVGHRLRLEVSSSNFPKYDRNTNTGGVIAQDTYDDIVVAQNAVYHDALRPSHLILPVIPSSNG